MNKRLLILIILSIVFCNAVVAQVENYTIDFKFGLGRSKLITFGNTNELFGNQWGNRVFAGIGYKGIHLNVGIQGYNEGLNKPLNYNNIIIPQHSSFSNQYVDFTVSYEYELVNRLYIEPSIGYARVRTVTNVLDTAGDEYNLESINGFSTGVYITKYLRLQKGFYLGPFINFSYDLIDYRLWNSDLDMNSIRMFFGVVLKGTN